ncbi:MAG: zinc metallopeptidase [Coriobacteriales bacterium]|nr:zinc metallopeptidase [Coriobacteriales bacterium]
MQLSYLAIVVISLVLGLGTQWYIKHTFNEWSQIPVATRETGAQISRRFLDSEGLTTVPIIPNGQGDLSDYYDPKTDSLNLSDSSQYGNSVASMAVACHEAGHAVQHARKYGPVLARTALVPAVNIGSQLWMIVLIAGIVINWSGLITLGIILFAVVVLFQIVTLPVEFDASNRALQFIQSDPRIPSDQAAGAKKMLVAAALTYVAAALTSILQLLYLLSQNRDN